MVRFLFRFLINAVALSAAIKLVPGITSSGDWVKLAAVAAIFGLVNATIGPVLKFMTCPAIVLTLGLFTLVINAFLLQITAWLSSKFDLGFAVAGFWPAFWGALIVTIVSAILSIFVPGKKKSERDSGPRYEKRVN